jgi:hypothetical protein
MSTEMLLSDTGYCDACAALQGTETDLMHSFSYVATLAYVLR